MDIPTTAQRRTNPNSPSPPSTPTPILRPTISLIPHHAPHPHHIHLPPPPLHANTFHTHGGVRCLPPLPCLPPHHHHYLLLLQLPLLQHHGTRLSILDYGGRTDLQPSNWTQCPYSAF